MASTASASAIARERITDALLSLLNIRVSGAGTTDRQTPFECYHPVHQSYPITKHSAAPKHDPGGVLRQQKQNGQGIVYDRDVVTTWRLPSVSAAYGVFF